MGLRPGRFFLSISVIGAFAFGAGTGFLWRESATTCSLAGVLLEDIRSLLADGRAVVNDPFLEYAMGPEDSFRPRIDLERELARRILARFGRFHLSLGFQMDLGKLPELEANSLETYLDGLENWRRTLHAVPEQAEELLAVPGGLPGSLTEPWYSDPALARTRLRELASSDHKRLEEAREKLPSLKHDWTDDSQVYCRSMMSLRRMALVQDAQKQGCAKGAGSKKRSCAKAALLKFQTEVDQLEKVRSLNEKKLRLKWGRKLYAGIHCD